MSSFITFIRWITTGVLLLVAVILIFDSSTDSEKVSQVSQVSKPTINQELYNFISEINHSIPEDEVRRPSSREMQSLVDAMKAKRDEIFDDPYCSFPGKKLHNPVSMKIQCTMAPKEGPEHMCFTQIKTGEESWRGMIDNNVVVMTEERALGYSFGGHLGGGADGTPYEKIGKTYPNDTIVIEKAIITHLSLINGPCSYAQNVDRVYIDFKRENVKIIPPN